MDVDELKNKPVAVLGYGVEGKATAAYLIKHGIKPVLFDQKSWDKWEYDQQKAIKALGLNFIFGPDYLKELTGFEVVFRSPGVRLVDVKKEVGGKTTITSQTKFFFENCPAKITGVTGTKGKGTTSALIYEMLKANGNSCYLTGNIGKVQPLEILDNLKPDDWVVYELSSFQLQDLNRSPHIAVILMITREHLDYHLDVQEYVQAKSNICRFQSPNDFVVSNSNYESSADIGQLGKGRKLDFSTLKPIVPGENADCYVDDGQIYLNHEKFLNTNDLQLRGEHNWQNVCASILGADAAGCDRAVIKEIARTFKGLEHRLEFAAEKNGIKFYNDSFSTTPETAIAAITSFTEPLIVILGGSSKNSDFSELGKIIGNRANIKAIILIGDEAAKIKKSTNYKGKILEGAENMEEIFTQIKSAAQSGDIVLLSPACASFDMFKSYSDRGMQFKKLALNFQTK